MAIQSRSMMALIWAFGLLASLASTAADRQIDYPPQLVLQQQALVTRAPDSASAASPMQSWMIERGYEAVALEVVPRDPTRGSKWVVYDTGQQKLVTAIQDLNALCGQTARPGLLGQRIAAVKRVGNSELFGTCAASGKGTYLGGHLIRDGKDLGIVQPGWEIVSFEDNWTGTLPGMDPRDRTGCLVLLRSPDGRQYRLYGIAPDQVVDLGLEGGSELTGFFALDTWVYFRSPDGRVMRKSLKDQSPPEPTAAEQVAPGLAVRTDPLFREVCRIRVPGSSLPHLGLFLDSGDLVKLEWVSGAGGPVLASGTVEDICRGLGENQIDQWPGSFNWARRFSARRPEEGPSQAHLLAAGHLQEGFLCFVRDGRANEPAHLFCYRPTAGPPADLGPLTPFEGQPLTTVYQLRVLESGRVAVVAGNDQVTVLQIYQNPLIDTMSAQVQAAMDEHYGPDPLPSVRIRRVDSLYRYGEQCDRGFDSMTVASDGKVYFGTMPHHPTKGTPIFRYDPQADKLEVLGDFDELVGNKGPGLIPNMMHTEPFEMNRGLYFTGQDPFYGNYKFPGMTPDNTRHLGSPLLMYDLKTGQFTNLGIPLPETNSIFFVTGDARRNVLYLRRGYYEAVWYSLKLGPDGKPIGHPEPIPFERQSKLVHVGPDGKLYYALPREAPTGAAEPPPLICDVYRFDPDTGKSQALCTIDIEKLAEASSPAARPRRLTADVEWIDGQHGREEVIGGIRSLDILVKVNTRTGQVSKVCEWSRGPVSNPRAATGAMKFHNGKVYCFWRCYDHPFYAAKLMVADVATGQVKHYGTLVDQNGRRVQQVTQLAIGQDGKVFFGGFNYGLPGDQYNLGRYSDPFRIDSCLYVIDAGID